MRSALIICLLLGLAGCSHDLTPAPGGDSGDIDRDGGAPDAAKPDLKGSDIKRPDLILPKDCGTKPPTSGPPPTGGCTKITGWVCTTKCGTYHRLACFKGKVLQRELRCNDQGWCHCIESPGSSPRWCAKVNPKSFKGCDISKEAFRGGCCDPSS